MALTEEELKNNFAKLADVIEHYKNKKGPLMPIMQAAQDIFGYISFDVQNFIAEKLGIPMTEVYGVATFYSQFSLEPKGKHVIGVCMGTACYVKGAQAVLDKLKEELGVEVGKTTNDGQFTLEATRCLGCCGLAPVLMIGDDVYGSLTANDIPEILNKYRGK
ncbi:MAG TPA: NADH-quinone oxidoreductase subunit NuoE [Clostridia bacterium]|nr:NADH-quinone oxidoreductase subunit NuoE [Clostridia bacterium]